MAQGLALVVLFGHGRFGRSQKFLQPVIQLRLLSIKTVDPVFEFGGFFQFQTVGGCQLWNLIEKGIVGLNNRRYVQVEVSGGNHPG